MATNAEESFVSSEELLSLGEQAISKARATNDSFFECQVGAIASVAVSGSVQPVDPKTYEGDAGVACARIVMDLWDNK